MPVEIELKFLLASPSDPSHPVLRDAQLIAYEQIYLRVTGTSQARIRKGDSGGLVSYRYAELTAIKPGMRQVLEYDIEPEEYERLSKDRDPSRHAVRKERRCFTWHDQFFELDRIREPASRVCEILEVQLVDEHQQVVLPDFLHVEREVTGETTYSNATIALG